MYFGCCYGMKGFDEFPMYKKADIVLQNAEYIGSFSSHKQKFMLYRIDAFFFEVCFDKYKYDIQEILLADRDRLHLYCPQLRDME